MKTSFAFTLATVASLMGSTAMAEYLDVEKDELTFGFIKLTDMAPLAIAYELGYFEDAPLIRINILDSCGSLNIFDSCGSFMFSALSHALDCMFISV